MSSLVTALRSDGHLTEADVEAARQLQNNSNSQLLEILVRIGAIDEATLLRLASEFWQIPLLNDAELPQTSEELLSAIQDMGLNTEWLSNRRAVVWWAERPSGGRRLWIAACNPIDPVLREHFDKRLSQSVSDEGVTDIDPIWALLSKTQWETIESLYRANQTDASDYNGVGDLDRLKELAEEAPIIDLVNSIFAAAIENRASDIHIEPYENFFEIRLRIDGVVHSWQRQPATRFDAVSTRIKLISSMDIAERRLPQDGRQSIRLSGKSFDLRVSTLPGSWGESLVLRLLPRNRNLPSLAELGIADGPRDAFGAALQQANGIVLVTGPTGSGKSTTLYTGLNKINDGKKKIITIEDPVEFDMERVVQVQVKAGIGLTFAAGLRSILRQDPDVIMIGEIRDPETAKIAIQAALTGHLVLSTLHTNSSVLAISRFIDLGIEPFQIGAAVKAIAAQRLVRKLCPECKVPHQEGPEFELVKRACDPQMVENILQNTRAINFYTHKGCPVCSGTGYSGRTALFEIVRIDEKLRSMLSRSPTSLELEQAARQQGFTRLIEDGLRKAVAGETSLDEVLRVVGIEALTPTQPIQAGLA